MPDFRSRMAQDATMIDCTDTVDIITFASNNSKTTVSGVTGVLRQSAARHLRSFSSASIVAGDVVFTIPKNNLPATYDPAIGDQIKVLSTDIYGGYYTSKDIIDIAFGTSYRFLCSKD